MIEKNPNVHQLIKNADLDLPLSDACLKMAKYVDVLEHKLRLPTHDVFYLSAVPPKGNHIKGYIVFLHDQTNSSNVWKDTNTLQTFAAFGYSCFALDLPGGGRTGGFAVEESDRPKFLCTFIKLLELRDVTIIGSSMAGQYIVPLLIERPSFYVTCIIAIALSNTNQLVACLATDILTPVLVLRGSYDTSLGQNAANNLKNLTNSRVLTVPNSKHLCYLNNSKYFHTVSLNFLDIVLNHITKSSFVSNV